MAKSAGHEGSETRPPGNAQAQPVPSVEPDSPAAEPPHSTRSYYPTPPADAPAEPPLAAIVGEVAGTRRSSSRNSDAVQLLTAPSQDVNINTDDAPTVITRPAAVAGPAAAGNGSPAITPNHPVAGRRLGHFELIEPIGSGGMAAVLKARDLELNRLVALKILPPEAARDAESLARFKQEARAAALLDHENIARVYFCGEDQGLHFIAFEFVEGVTLRALIDQRGPLPVAECLHYMLQAAAGLHHAAERGVIHRDIKPSNIIITPTGRLKIVDMGLARLHQAGWADDGVTHSGVTLGTFDYISPEQALDPRRADVRSDIYSLGCTFYHALTGQPPVAEGTAASKLYAHQHLRPTDPRLLNPAIPDEVAVILGRMMAKDPSQRYQTPLELIAELKGVAERLQVTVEPPDSTVQGVPSQAPLPELPQRWPLGWMAAALALLTVAITLWQVWRPPVATPPAWAEAVPPLLPSPTPPAVPEQPPAAEVPKTAEVTSLNDLLQAARDPAVVAIRFAAGEWDLSQLPEPLVVRSARLEWHGSLQGVTRIRLRAATTDAPPERRAPGSLTIIADSFSAHRIDWEILPPADSEEVQANDAAVPAATDNVAAAEVTHATGIVLSGLREVRLNDCTFSSQIPAELEGTTLHVAGGSQPLTIVAERCVWLQRGGVRGATALTVPAGVQLTLEDCGFGPHQAMIRVAAISPDRTPSRTELRPSTIQLRRSSFMVDRRSAVVAAASPVLLRCGYCVFAAPQNPLLPDSMGTVLQLPQLSNSRYEGIARNAYFLVAPLALGANGASRSYSFEECRQRDWPIQDADAVRLKRPPWADPRPLRLLDEPQPWAAFRLRIEQDAEPALFVRDQVRVLGAQFRDESVGYRAYPGLIAWPPPPKEPAASGDAGPRQLIWHPTRGEGESPAPGVFTDLSALLRQVKPDDIILIRHDGPLPFDHTEILELRPRNGGTEFKITFKPYPKSRPVLTVDPASRVLDQFLFQLRAGAVEFVDLHFLLKPSLPQNPLQTAVAVSLLSGRGCTFERCVFTLAEEDDARAAVVHIGDPDRVMAMEGVPRPVPNVRFVNCLVRGKGRAVWLAGGRTAQIEWINSLTAIAGPMVQVEAGSRTGGEVTVRLNHVTALLGGPVIEMYAARNGEGRPGQLPRVVVDSESCLFVALLAAGRALVELHDFEGEIPTYLAWQTRKGNRYANFDNGAITLLARPPVESAAPVREWDWNQWFTFANEPPAADKPLGQVVFAQPPEQLRDLVRLTPADLRIRGVRFPDVEDVTSLDCGVADLRELPELPPDKSP